MKDYQPYELADALWELEYGEGELSRETLRVALLALKKEIDDVREAINNHGHDAFRRY